MGRFWRLFVVVVILTLAPMVHSTLCAISGP
jgi:hypothetical protein